MKVALGIEYRGINFFGWQRQREGRTVQAGVEQALSKIANCSIQITCAGRTDTGVHAVGQVVHFETNLSLPMRAWILGTNTHLPEDITILWAQEVADEFSARFSALSRTYRYYILNRVSCPAIGAGLVTWVKCKLELEKMQQAALCLIGEHDFNSFRALNCQAAHPVRKIYSLELTQCDNLFVLSICANGFLYHMVRNIVGALIWVGSGKQEVSWMESVLEAKDRLATAPTAKPDGLYLYNVDYGLGYRFPAPTEPKFIFDLY